MQPVSNEEKIQDTKVIVFRLQTEEYGVEVEQVKSIERLEQVTRIPRTPKFVKGVINLRGSVIPIIDLAGRFDLEESKQSEQSRIIVVSVGNMEVGLIVDSANDVIDIPAKQIEPPPQMIKGISGKFLRGVAKLEDRLLILLNLDQVLTFEEIQQLEAIGEQ